MSTVSNFSSLPSFVKLQVKPREYFSLARFTALLKWDASFLFLTAWCLLAFCLFAVVSSPPFSYTMNFTRLYSSDHESHRCECQPFSSPPASVNKGHLKHLQPVIEEESRGKDNLISLCLIFFSSSLFFSFVHESLVSATLPGKRDLLLCARFFNCNQITVWRVNGKSERKDETQDAKGSKKERKRKDKQEDRDVDTTAYLVQMSLLPNPLFSLSCAFIVLFFLSLRPQQCDDVMRSNKRASTVSHWLIVGKRCRRFFNQLSHQPLAPSFTSFISLDKCFTVCACCMCVVKMKQIQNGDERERERNKKRKRLKECVCVCMIHIWKLSMMK